MSLRTGATLITLSLLINKISGLYGLLAVLTGVSLSPLQLSMYIYSIFAFVLTAFLAPHVRKQSPLQCIALAWFYVLDSLINAAYTAMFAMTWFLVISQHHHEKPPSGPGASTISDTSGFTSPKFNVSSVEVVAAPASGLTTGQDAVAAGTPSSSAAGAGGSGSPSMSHGVLQPESFNSIGIICTLWTIRVYFCLVMLAYARFVLRQSIAASAKQNTSYISASTSSYLAENPFAENRPEGQGYKGRLGRYMINIGRTYWLGNDEDDSWMSGMGGKFRKSGEGGAIALENGPIERERRRRSGTGPPAPPQPVSMAGHQPVKLQDLA